jgi:hypothetical protein
MPRPVKERVICGQTYRVTLLGALQGRTMLVRLIKTVGPALAAFIEGLLNAKGGLTESLALGSADAIRDLALKLSDKDLADISDQLAHFTTVIVIPNDTEPQLDKILDEHFAGRYDAYTQWLGFALEANFSSFFGASSSGGRDLLSRLKALIASASTSPTASTGTSTASPQASATPTA